MEGGISACMLKEQIATTIQQTVKATSESILNTFSNFMDCEYKLVQRASDSHGNGVWRHGGKYENDFLYVIEEAVKAAVDFIMSEFTDVVDKRFADFQLDILGKENEIECLKLGLEISRSKLKAVREYLNSAEAHCPERNCEPPVSFYEKENEEERLRVLPLVNSEMVHARSDPHHQDIVEASEVTGDLSILVHGWDQIGSIFVPDKGAAAHTTTEKEEPAVPHLNEFPPVEEECVFGKEYSVTVSLDSSEDGDSAPEESSELGEEEEDGSETGIHDLVQGEMAWAPLHVKRELPEVKVSSSSVKMERVEQEKTPNVEVTNEKFNPHQTGSNTENYEKSIQQTDSHQKPNGYYSRYELYSCTECWKTFTKMSYLRKHQRIHSGVKPYSCTACKKTFSRSEHLKRHLRVHTGEKPYSCPECPKTFSRPEHLKGHLRVHTGEKPYSCNECGKTFGHLMSVKTHQSIHTGEKPFSCTECGKAYSHLVSLKAHKRIHRREKLYAAGQSGKTVGQSSLA
ncbi:zinc finger protein 184-like [Erpetoichthys calabaricus]|uniref:zinc finger protein 184-like n=1 Tax=Erpetoichthys calabaricus TaxID=27687 RepID=UPI0022345364|nr:zinc finger protein 184-like [Erpetoichthys calabaricus]